ncbi:MAG: hypothetical protein ABIJ09_25375 [Pseudomonadota bacterium]
MKRPVATRSGVRLLVPVLLVFTAACPECAPGTSTLRFDCKTSTECTVGFECVAGECVREGARIDAAFIDAEAADAPGTDHMATDRTSADLSAADAQAADTQADAGAQDVAGMDAPGLDGAASDSMVVDSTFDAALMDAARSDTALNDATLDDAAGIDAATGDAGTCAPDAGSSPWTLTPAMSRRASGGPFAVATGIQGAVRADICTRGDAIAVARGSYLGRSFYQHFDPTQGSLVVWISPEWDATDLQGEDRTLLAAGDFEFGVDAATLGAFLRLGNNRHVMPGAFDTWLAGDTHFVVLRWDAQHDIGAGRVSLVVDDHAPYEIATSIVVTEVADPIILGAADLEGRGSLGALLEGLTIYRRVLADSAGGVSLGHDDEVGEIYAAGPGTEPTLITGSWDVVLALPGDAEEGLLPATGQAFSHPHSANMLGMPGYLLAPAARQAWELVQAGSNNVSLSGAQPQQWIYGAASQLTTTEAGAGMRLSASTGGATSLVLRAIVHSDGTAIPALILQNASGNDITALTGSAATSRDHPDVLILTAEIPASPALVHVMLVNRVSTNSSIFVHQVEVLPNLLANPSFETGSDVDPTWQPDDWLNHSTSALRTYKEQSTVHSGATAVAIEGIGTGGYHDIRTLTSVPGLNQLRHFFGTGAMFWSSSGAAPGIRPDNGCLMQLAAPVGKFDVRGRPVTGTWQHVAGVGRRHDVYTDGGVNCQNDMLRFGGQWGAALQAIIDDAYLIHLEQVDLTPLPADLSRSLEQGYVRHDGEDSLAQPITDLTANSGRIDLALGLNHPVSLRDTFCPYDAVLWQAWNDASNNITLRFNWDQSSSRVGIRVDAYFDSQHFDYVVLGLPIDGMATHVVSFSYQTGGRLQLLLDGDPELDQPMGSMAFGRIPETLYVGHDHLGDGLCDLRVDVNGASFSTP